VRDELEADTRPLWAPAFLDAVRVWTKADQFVAPADVFIQDDAELEREFQKRGVQFVWSPAKEGVARFASLYHALGVRSLVATVSTSVDEPTSQELSPSDPLLLLTPAAKR